MNGSTAKIKGGYGYNALWRDPLRTLAKADEGATPATTRLSADG